MLPSTAKWRGLLLWAGSGAVLSFGVRSFSNNIEAALLALCLVALERLDKTVQASRHSLYFKARRADLFLTADQKVSFLEMDSMVMHIRPVDEPGDLLPIYFFHLRFAS